MSAIASRLLVLCASFLLPSLTAAQPTSECKDVLKDGVFGVVKFSNYDRSEEHYYDWLKTVSRSDAGKASDFGLEVTIPTEVGPVPFGITKSDDEWSKFEGSREKLKKSDVTRERLLKSFSRVGDKGILNAWLGCMKLQINSQAKSAALAMEVTKNSDVSFTIRIRFDLPGPLVKATVINPGGWYVSNAALDNGQAQQPTAFPNDQVVRTFSYTKASPNKDVLITIKTDRGELFDYLPGAPLPPPAPVLTMKTIGKDFSGTLGQQGEIQLAITSKADQTVRVWGGSIVQSDGTPYGTSHCWIFKDSKVPANQLYDSGTITLTLTPNKQQPATYIHGKLLYGTPVCNFDVPVPIAKGQTITFLGHESIDVQKGGAKNFLLFVDYLD